MTADYKSTLFLPETDFPMRAGLPQREPELLARWEAMDLYAVLREDSKGREKFILHDGPPYANGHLHIGHALNKILKDVINRSQQMLGKDANYVPGWDCHGLPIEWKIEEKYRAAGRNKDEVDIVAFRRECREFADHWIGVQREEFQRLGVTGDWKNPYTTMAYPAEAQIVRELGKFVMNGMLYRGSKPVMWSCVEKTALAEAEVEYHEHKSTTIDLAFPVVTASRPEFEGAFVVIWTTTPWTIPGNRAIAYGAGFDYRLIEVTELAEKSGARLGQKLLYVAELLEDSLRRAGIAGHRELARFKGDDLAGTVCAHPLRGQGYDYDVPLLAGDHVTTEQGTGFVHIAPGHGAEDWVLGMANGIEVPHTVGEDGAYFDHVPLFAGARVLTPEGKEGDANGAVIRTLAASGAMLGKASLRHSYPHSWRSKAPLIFRNTSQWFVSMEHGGLRDTALAAIDATRFVPAAGKTRLRGMIETRPDWVLSRQRAWGVPIAVFVHKETGEILRDQAVIDRIAQAVEEEGADVWFADDPQRFLGNDYKAQDYEQVRDILDVWFDSGSTHAFCLEQRADLQWPASLYLEGSDQHRGWFHSSLLESCGTRGRAPYDAVLTHGFVMDGEGRKMSKSLGNVVAPQKVIDQLGADILRIWVVSADYSEDLRISDEILKYQADSYRRLRNTLRYLLGNLAGFSDEERIDVADMPELERWVLHRLAELDTQVRQNIADFDFHELFIALHNFCATDLSAFYFDIRKDALYCDAANTVRRRAARTVLDHLFSCLTAWLAPILAFTAEEAWLTRFPGEGESVHRRLFPDVPADWRDDRLAARWARVRRLRRVVTGAIEVERREKRLGASLQAHPHVWATAADITALEDLDLAEIAITSAVTVQEGEAPAEAYRLEDVRDIGVIVHMADGQRCERCWMVLEEVGQDPIMSDTCRRCATAVAEVADVSEVGS
ncbi:MAG: isoleucine--tRNA ligase [Proteobacteria bacterium]|nr:isoleucine--tRNA ligase [Pseudomonadota bacterium]MDA1070835.1 isoleucine--tRNA ligase [Pseudomonadota bacterium]